MDVVACVCVGWAGGLLLLACVRVWWWVGRRVVVVVDGLWPVVADYWSPMVRVCVRTGHGQDVHDGEHGCRQCEGTAEYRFVLLTIYPCRSFLTAVAIVSMALTRAS